MALSREEREQFLSEPHVAALAVAASPDRGPLLIPVWYYYELGDDEVWVMTSVDSRKAKAIEKAGRFSLMVERIEPTVRYVSIEGPVTGTTEGTDALHRELASRYLPADAVPGYLAMAETELGPQVIIHMRPEHWLSADLGAF